MQKPSKHLERQSMQPTDRQALLEKRLKALRARGGAPGIPRLADRSAAPLSFDQERQWLLDQIQPGSSAFNRPVALRLRGPFDVPILLDSLERIVRRHEVLRMTFPSSDGRPTQAVASVPSLTLPVVDLGRLPAEEREREAQRLAGEETRRPFDLAHGPLVRASLLRLSDTHHVLVFVTHHIVFDAWSAKVFARELKALYDALSSGNSPSLPELPIQYADFAHWQRERLKGETLESHRAYWLGQLGGELPTLDLPTDRPRPPVRTPRGAARSSCLPGALAASLRGLGRQEDATLFMVLLAAFYTLLSRCSAQEDIVVGVPTAGREQVETEALIGCFTNTLALRCDLGGDPPFRELLRRVRKMAREAYTHQGFPFAKLVEELRPERDLSRTPVYQVLFNLENIPESPLDADGLAVEEFAVDPGTAPLDLMLEIVQREEGLACLFVYDADLFDGATIGRMAEHYRVLLEGIVAEPDRRLSELPLLTDAERHRLLVEWNDTQADFPDGACVHELFEAQVERAPEAIAVVFDGQQLTYRELNAGANQLAHYLRGLGVGPEALVGLCLERSVHMPVAVLGVLKAGGAYVPLEPEYPKERLAVMLADANVRVLVTQEHLLEALPDPGAPVVCLDRDRAAIAQQPETNARSGVTAANLAYVVYTSGSTGRPKGVLITRRSLCSYVHAVQAAVPLTAEDRALLKAPVGFDFWAGEFFQPLVVGARLVLARRGGGRDRTYLAGLVAEQEITAMQFVPAMLRAFLEEPGLEESCRSLRVVICAGDVMPTEVRDRFHERVNAELFNTYGPTEATIEVTFHRCERGGHPWTIPIGRPGANTQVYLLDRHLNPVPVGVPGELHIGGEQLARGYLESPELTAEKFIPHPFTDEPGARLYKTGDLVRYLPDGEIEFLGRLDHQVKVRGFRIEPGEIETALGQHPAVRQAIVAAREDLPGDRRLVAYVVPGPAAAPNPTELRRFLRQRLPEYMVPAAFVMLDALPLTPSGKVDRRRLPAPGPARPELEQAYVVPRSRTEEALAAIWSEVLGVERVGIHDSFFELGGNSLLAAQVVSRIRLALGVAASLRSFFDAPTVAGLAERLERAGDRAAEVQPPAIRPIPRKSHRAKATKKHD